MKKENALKMKFCKNFVFRFCIKYDNLKINMALIN